MKRTLSLLLVLAMLVTCLPLTVFAADGSARAESATTAVQTQPEGNVLHSTTVSESNGKKTPRIPEPSGKANLASTFSITDQGSGFGFTTFADLKDLAGRTYDSYVYAEYIGTGPLVIEEDLEIPEQLELYVWDTEIIVPQGVTFACDSYIFVSNVTVNGTAYTNSLNVQDALVINGTLYNENWIWLSASASLVGEENIEYTNPYAGISIGYVITDFDSLEDACSIAEDYLADNNTRVQLSLEFVGNPVIDQSITIPSNCQLYTWEAQSTTIAAGCTLTLEGSMYVETPLYVEGRLVNMGYIDIYVTEYSEGCMTIADSGSYTGSGWLYVTSDTLTDPGEALPGLDLNDFDITEHDNMEHYWELHLVAGLTKLPSPTNLEWGYDHEYWDPDTDELTTVASPGTISWKSALPNNGEYLIRVYKEGQDEELYRYGWSFSETEESVWHSIDNLRLENDMETGNYYFTVVSRGDYETTMDSDPVFSALWHYTRPSVQVGICTNLSWEFPGIRYDLPADMEYVRGYEVEFYYTAPQSSVPELLTTVWHADAENGFYPDLWEELYLDYGAGYYTFRVRALSSDITAACAGEWSEMSPAYVLDEDGYCNHEYDDWYVTEESTCESEGLRTRDCTICGHSETEPIPPMDHSYGDPAFNWAEDYSCTAVFTCSQCDGIESVICTVTSETTPATSTQPGEAVHSAEVEFQGATYSDSVTQILPPVGDERAQLGDLNQDGRVNFKDAIQILQFASSRITAEEIRLDAADVSGDNRYNFKDAILILQFASNRVTSFPCEEDVITRGQWIDMLVEAYGYPRSESSTDSYMDTADSEYRSAIETAVIYGVLTPAEGEYFRPDDLATREFAAETAVNCMGYSPNGVLDCSDTAEIRDPAAAKQAVDSDLFDLEYNHFLPLRALRSAEAERILAGIEDIFNSADDNSSDVPEGIVFNEGVVTKSGPFDWETDGVSLIVPADEEVPQVGQIITFGTEKAIRIESVSSADGVNKVTYSIPEMFEYLDYINVQGDAMMDFAQFVPAEGVTVTSNTAPAIQTFGFADDWFDKPNTEIGTDVSATLEGDIDLGDGWAINYSLELNIPTVAYKFDVDFDSNPFNDEPPVNVKNAYIKVQNDMNIHVDIGNGFDTGDDEFEDSIYDDILEKEIPLGNVPLVGVNGLGVVVEIDLVITAEGKFEVDYNVHGTVGVQVLNNRPRNISALQSSLSLGLAASISVGPRLGLEVEIFDEDILDCYAEIGAKSEGSIHLRSTGLLCMDANCHVYAELVAFEDCLIDDWLDISVGWEIWDATNSPVKVVAHWENFEKVPECTYEKATIKGTVASADDRTFYIENAKIYIRNHDTLEEQTTVYSDANGAYTAVVPGDTYLVHISADGYIPFESLETVGDHQVIYLETYLMVEGDEDSGETSVIGGNISNSVNGIGISGAKLTIRKGWNQLSGEVVETVYTDYNGNYSVELPLGNFTVAMECSGYVSNHINVAVTSSGNNNCNGVMNPDGSSSIDLGDMRIILTWTDEPADLDSHLWGPTVDGDDWFHIAYYDMEYYYDGETKAFLDIDDTWYDGPETTTIYDMTNNGVYSFYVHDYTSYTDSSSTVLAHSGAKVQVYMGETLIAQYFVPTSGVGTVWHVFDFDATTGTITGVNTFSTARPSEVGSPYSYYSLRPVQDPLKDYELAAEAEPLTEVSEAILPEETVEVTVETIETVPATEAPADESIGNSL